MSAADLSNTIDWLMQGPPLVVELVKDVDGRGSLRKVASPRNTLRLRHLEMLTHLSAAGSMIGTNDGKEIVEEIRNRVRNHLASRVRQGLIHPADHDAFATWCRARAWSGTAYLPIRTDTAPRELTVVRARPPKRRSGRSGGAGTLHVPTGRRAPANDA